MKFLSDRVMVLKAFKIKKQILYETTPLRFYPDMAGIHKKQKEFDSVRQHGDKTWYASPRQALGDLQG